MINLRVGNVYSFLVVNDALISHFILSEISEFLKQDEKQKKSSYRVLCMFKAHFGWAWPDTQNLLPPLRWKIGFFSPITQTSGQVVNRTTHHSLFRSPVVMVYCLAFGSTEGYKESSSEVSFTSPSRPTSASWGATSFQGCSPSVQFLRRAGGVWVDALETPSELPQNEKRI